MATTSNCLGAEKDHPTQSYLETAEGEGLLKTNNQGIILVPQPSDDPLDPLVGSLSPWQLPAMLKYISSIGA